MTDWIEVFKAGKHRAASGVEREWTVADLQHMAEAYDPHKHEAPMVIGHPKDNAPAYGWIKGLKVQDDRLLALPGQVAPEFAELVQAGRFKKRSISIYPDGTLRHVGFLGAQPPAVKGLKDIEFAADAAEIYEYADTEDAQMTELEKLQQQLAEERQKRQAAEQQVATTTAEKDKVAADFAELERRTKHQEIESFIDQGIKEGKILPAWKEKGLAEFMGALDTQEQTYEFSDGKKETPLNWFKGFLQSFAEHQLFKEMNKPKGEAKTDDFAEEEKLGKAIAAKVTAARA